MHHTYNLRPNPKPSALNTNPTRRSTTTADMEQNDTNTNTPSPHDSSLENSDSSDTELNSVVSNPTRQEDTTSPNPTADRDQESDKDIMRLLLAQMQQQQHEMKQQHREITQSMGEMKCELTQQMTQQNMEMKYELTQQISSVEKGMTDIRQDLSGMAQEMKDMKQETNVIRQELILTQNKLDEQRREVKHELKTQEAKFESRFVTIQSEVREEINNRTKDLCTIHDVQHEVETVKGQCSKEIQDSIKDLKDDNIKYQEAIEHCQNETKQVSQQLEKCMSNNNKATADELYDLLTQCTTTGQHNLENVPKFNGRNINPKEFLNQANKHYDKLNNRPGRLNQVNYLELIESMLTDTALNWYHIVRDTINTKEEFEIGFIKQYWNRETQLAIRKKVENDRYLITSRMNKVEYATKQILTLKHLTPALGDDEIIQILADHYDYNTKESIRMQHINSITGLLELLNRSDANDQHDKIKAMYNNNYQSADGKRSRQMGFPETNRQRFHYTTDQRRGREPQDFRACAPGGWRGIDPGPRTDIQHQRTRTADGHPPNYHRNAEPERWQRSTQNTVMNERGAAMNGRPVHNYNQRDSVRINQYPTDEQRRVCTTVLQGEQSKTKKKNKPTSDHNFPVDQQLKGATKRYTEPIDLNNPDQ